jgi:mono/diheme cytochrome c family protein
MVRRTIMGLLTGLPLTVLSLSTYADSTGKWTSGEETYKKVCAYCHEAGVGPYLLGRQFPAAVIEYMARNGSRAMPAMKPGFIDDAALKRVAEYIEKSQAGPNAPKASINDSQYQNASLVTAAATPGSALPTSAIPTSTTSIKE